MMRTLGYPRLISMENFRSPNFLLVAELLEWLVQRIDTDVDIPDAIETQDQRILFLKSVAELFYYKARIKLNLKRLYSANGLAVKELLKIATVLVDAHNVKNDGRIDMNAQAPNLQLHSTQFTSSLKRIRDLASELTSIGSGLHGNLEKELELRRERLDAIGKPHNVESIKRSITQSLEESKELFTNLSENIQALSRDEQKLESKLKRRTNESDRTKKRLARLKTFKPTFMEEYEKREKALNQLFTKYIQEYRNLEYLEYELEKIRQNEEHQMQENERQLANMRKKLREEELKILRGEMVETDTFNSPLGKNMHQNHFAPKRPRAASGKRPPKSPNEFNPDSGIPRNQNEAVVKGSMFDDEDDDGSSGEYSSSEEEYTESDGEYGEDAEDDGEGPYSEGSSEYSDGAGDTYSG